MGCSHVMLIDIRSFRVSTLFRIAIVVLFLFTSTHANFTSYADTASLISNGSAELSAGCKPWEFFRTEDNERLGLDLQAVRDLGLPLSCSRSIIQLICILGILQFFIQAETKSIFSFMANRQVREDKITSGLRAIQVHHTSNRATSQNSQFGWVIGDTALGDGPGLFQSSEEEIICIDGKGNVVVSLLALENAQFNDRWRIYRTTVGRC